MKLQDFNLIMILKITSQNVENENMKVPKWDCVTFFFILKC